MRRMIVAAAFVACGCGNGEPPQVREAVKNELLDPFSAEFRNVRQRLGNWCGEVNAKNRMGGYVGWSLFGAVEVNGKWSAYIVKAREGGGADDQSSRIGMILCGLNPNTGLPITSDEYEAATAASAGKK
ncbi:MAG: hypothetical protein Q8R82_05315 [Hyphomonadaceae bacterium]|nr:hypothetical protein [Hyphomonadaceae bacterium]